MKARYVLHPDQLGLFQEGNLFSDVSLAFLRDAQKVSSHVCQVHIEKMAGFRSNIERSRQNAKSVTLDT